jgi:site-specific DNA recombinase
MRVSSKDQSRGTSLEEQKSYITQYAKTKDFSIVEFYEEVESASKIGRELFDEMVQRLKKEGLRGIIFHKVDRSARNPRDQALLYELLLEGYEFHFVTEGISTVDPIGRNMMYIMWGLASGYSENLKAEVNKGIMGRLKQGRWPYHAPLGYISGPDCTKLISPVKGPMVKKLFEEYATGRYSVKDLMVLARKIGLTNSHGKALDKNALHQTLRRTFYYGLMTHGTRGAFQGEHDPLISKSLYDKVQFVLSQRGFKRNNQFDYSFWGLLKCHVCGRPLKSMTSKKRYHYYHCRDWQCGVKTIAETGLEAQFLEALKRLQFTDEEADMFKKAVMIFHNTTTKSRDDLVKGIDLEIGKIQSRLSELLHKWTDQKIDDESYIEAKKVLLNKEVELKEQRTSLEKTDEKAFTELEELVKLLRNPAIAYEKADRVNKRRLMISMVENLGLHEKTLTITWRKHFALVANRPKPQKSRAAGNRTRSLRTRSARTTGILQPAEIQPIHLTLL